MLITDNLIYEPGKIPPELATQAALEAVELQQNVDFWTAIEGVAQIEYSAARQQGGDAPFITIRPHSERVFKLLPHINEVARTLNLLPPRLFHLNYSQKGQWVPPHRDMSSGKAKIVTLCGTGRFATHSTLDATKEEVPLHQVEVGPGDYVRLDNNMALGYRAIHSALNIGTVDRISLGIPVRD